MRALNGAPSAQVVHRHELQVRKEAATAIGLLATSNAIPTLVDWLEDEHSQVRQAVARAINALRSAPRL